MDNRAPPPSANANGAGYGNGTDDMSGFYAEVRLSIFFVPGWHAKDARGLY
jgi:hypothetical protein